MSKMPKKKPSTSTTNRFSRRFVSAAGSADTLRHRGEASFLPVMHIRRGEETLIDVPVRF